MKRLLATRKRQVVAGVVTGIMLVAASAVAALVVYDLTATGSVPGQSITITQTHAGALIYSGTGTNAPALDSNAQVLVPVRLTNADPNNAHVVGPGLTITVTDDQQPATCNSFLSHPAISANLITPTSVPAGSSVNGTLTVALANAPLACSGTTFTAVFSGVASS